MQQFDPFFFLFKFPFQREGGGGNSPITLRIHRASQAWKAKADGTEREGRRRPRLLDGPRS